MSTDNKKCSILAIDIGGGTQDILLWDPGKNIENCIKMILPSPTQIVGNRIQKATERGVPIILVGRLMGGGALTRAVKAHLKAGFPVYSLKAPALSIHDNLDKVREIGVKIVSEIPAAAEKIHCADVDRDVLTKCLALFDVSFPHHFAIAVQDHGYCPDSSNRAFRFNYWKTFLARGGLIADLWNLEPPEYMTRMWAVARSLENAIVMDTGAAAILGALCDEKVNSRLEEGVVVLNVGNFHTVAARVRGNRVLAIYEHHTGLLNEEKVHDHLVRFTRGTLTNEEIFNEWGHGCAYAKNFSSNTIGLAKTELPYVAVTGPKRNLVKQLGFDFVAPYGDMMLSGAFGLLEAAKNYWQCKH